MDRYRTRGSFTGSSFSNGGTYSNGSPTPNGFRNFPETSGTVESMWDQSDGLFYRNRLQGIPTFRPMTKIREDRVPSRGANDLRATRDSQSAYGSGDILRHFLGQLIVTEPSWTSIDDRAIVQAHAGVVPTQALSAVSLYELDKTIELFKNAGNLALRAKSTVLKLHDKRTRDRIKRGLSPTPVADTASNYWLQAQYGWLPLYYDLKGHIAAFNRSAERPAWQTARGTASDEIRTTNTATWGPWSAWGGSTGFSVLNTGTYTVKCRAGILYADDLDPKRRMASDLGLDLHSTPQIVWEIIPWSFVIDWFIDVGTWLEALKPKPGVRVLGTYRSIFTVSLAEQAISNSWFSGNMTGNWSSSTRSVLLTKKRRYTSAPLPPFPPSGTGVSSIQRSLSAAALSFQQLRRLTK